MPNTKTLLVKRFGRLRVERDARGITQDDAQARTGIDRATLSRIERGHRRPTQQQVESLAELFGVTPATIRAWVEILPGPAPAPVSSTEVAR